jgi:hypothetical protein
MAIANLKAQSTPKSSRMLHVRVEQVNGARGLTNAEGTDFGQSRQRKGTQLFGHTLDGFQGVLVLWKGPHLHLLA